MFHLANNVRTLVEAAPGRINRGSAVRTARRWLPPLCALATALLPLDSIAQITEPLLPSAVAPSVPQLPAAPGEEVISPGETVTTRPHPEFNPIGYRVGDFFFFPRGEADEAYNSNIFATTSSPTHDFITALQPSFDLLSIFPRNALNVHGISAFQLYADNRAQNTQDGTINVDGRLDMTAGSSFYGNAQVAHQHISYGSPNSPGGIAQPVTYWDYIARAGYAQTGRRFTYQIDVGTESAQYNAVPLVGGGVSPQSTQDVTISEASLRAGYELIPDYVGYVRVAGSLYDYWHTVQAGTRPNSTVYHVDLGLQILPRHIIYGEAYAGYLVQNFAASSLGSTQAPDYGGRLVWNVTRLTTLTFNGARSFVTGTPGSPTLVTSAGNGYLASTVTASADHELLRNVLLNLSASYENDSFQGISRSDNVFGAGAGVKYLVNRNLFLGGSYTYYQRNSTASGVSYSQNVVMLRVGTQF